MQASDLQKMAIYRAFLIRAHKRVEGRKNLVGRSEGPPLEGGTSSDLLPMTYATEMRGEKVNNRLIEIPMHKGCRLFLTAEEYKNGIRRGKAIMRSRQARERAQKRKGRGDS